MDGCGTRLVGVDYRNGEANWMSANDNRIERDLLGTREVPAGALYGIHTKRAIENFPICNRAIRRPLVHAFAAVKLACARTNRRLAYLDEVIAGAVEAACEEIMEGGLDEWFVVDALQGGAGTSTNMNVNEVIANRALQILDRPLGDYATVDPIEHVNLHQSTNDTFPTALKVAAIRQLRALERSLVSLVEAFQQQEKEMASVVKIGRTQYQDAVLITLGREMAAYAEAFGRDRWRVYKCEERLRVVNLGGTAIGTGLGAPRDYIFAVVDCLKEITGLGLARAENLVEATQNTDVFVEVSGILKACASNLLKVCSDLRLLSCGPTGGPAELRLPQLQAGSSIMPSKVNPVIPEAVSQAALMVMANDVAVTQACSMGSLELNAFLPLIAETLLGSIELLDNACSRLAGACVRGLKPDMQQCGAQVEAATATVTALVASLGYKKAEEIAMAAEAENRSVREVTLGMNVMSEEEYRQLVSPEAVTQLGSRGRAK